MKHAPIHVALYHGAKRPKPTEQTEFEGGWHQLIASLHDLIALPPNEPEGAPAAAQKESMIAWAPHRLCKPYRSKANVTEVTLLAIDVDGGDVPAIVENLEAMGWAGLVYGTPSDSDDLPDTNRRVRVISPISRSLKPAESELARYAYAEALGLAPGCGVDGTADCSRLYFIGCLHGTPERLWLENEGTAVDVDDLLQLELEHDWGHGSAKPSEPGKGETFEADRRLAMAVAVCETRPAAVEGQQGHRALYPVLDELTALYPKDPQAVADICWEHYNPRCIPPWPDSERRRFEWEAKRAHERAKAPEYKLVQRDYDKRLVEWEAEDERRKALEAKRTEAQFAQPVQRETDQYGGLVDWEAPIAPLRYLCEGLGIGWVGKVAGVHGYAGTSKGLFVARLLLSAAAGLPFLGHAVKRVPVVYYDCETGEMVENRIKRLAKAMGIDLAALARDGWWNFRHTSEKLASLVESGSLETHCREVDKGEGVALGLDSYSSMVEGNENDSEYADPLWALGRMCRDANVCPVVVMHDRKSQGERGKGSANALEGVSGTNRLAAALASSIRLTPSEDNDRVITVACTRAPERRFEPIELTWVDTAEGGIAAECEAKHLATPAERAREKSDKDVRKHVESIARKADAVESLVSGALANDMTVRKIRAAIPGMSGDVWLEVKAELFRRGSVVEDRNGRDVTYRRNAGTKPPALAKPSMSLPQVRVSTPAKRPTIAERIKMAPRGMNSAQSKTLAISQVRREAKRSREGAPAPI